MDQPTPADDFLERFETTGDWGPNPWFLDEERERSWGPEWQRLGLTREKRLIADAALRKIFPPEVVKQIRADSAKWAGWIITLFGGVMLPGMVADLLDLGVDAALTKPWEDAATLRSLQLRARHLDAAFEIGVHASLERAGVNVRRVPETPTGKRHDFDVEFRGVRYEIEVKLSRASQHDHAVKELSEALMRSHFVVPGFHLTMRGSEHMAEVSWDSPQRLEGLIPDIVKAYGEAVAVLRSKSSPGTYPAGEWGQLEAEPGHEHGSLTDASVPDLPEEKKARRLQRKLRDGLEQLSGTQRGVLVLGTYGAARPDLVERYLLEDIGSASKLARKCVMVVCRDETMVHDDGFAMPRRYPMHYAFSPLRTRELRPAERKLALALSSTHWTRSVEMELGKPGGLSTGSSTARQPRTLWRSGSVRLEKPGDSVTCTFDGSGQLRVVSSSQ